MGILLSAQEVKGIKKGDKVQYSFKLKKTDKQLGKVTYLPAQPIFDKDSKDYVYELEAKIDIKELYRFEYRNGWKSFYSNRRRTDMEVYIKKIRLHI